VLEELVYHLIVFHRQARFKEIEDKLAPRELARYALFYLSSISEIRSLTVSEELAIHHASLSHALDTK